jgi:uncharacterized protein YggE
VINLKINNLLKSKFSFPLIMVSAFIFMLGLFITSPANAYADDMKPVIAAKPSITTGTLSVTGNGEVNATPDIAYISLGVTTEKTTVGEAQSINSDTMNKLIASIENQGIDKNDIKTDDFSISPKYNYNEKTGESTLAGYTVSNTLNVTVRNISKAGQVIDSAVQSGANVSTGISFGVSDYEKYYNTALANAMANAKSKAQVMADALNVNISTPVKVSELSSSTPVIHPIYYPEATGASAKNSTSIESGTYKISASVSADYEY